MAMIDRMPDNSTIDDIIEELYFKIQVDEGLRQLDNGEYLTNEEVKERISKWIIK
ncbi:MAG TPA: hypothetical protein PKY56_00285 [Candidatus Kapabacteria bacterium]|nr:hypothetical protein [Candidatus Kapabacteria bacterium]HPO61573.1 hypothetical protein [Candidatus Kapabacteria bacterium]